jgi:signal transduction histidine kinase/ActR/RegA family two-component response regulator
MAATEPARSWRILVLPTTAADGSVSRSILDDAGMPSLVCRHLGELLAALEGDGAGALLLTDEALRPADRERLAQAVQAQPPWSDLPILLLCARGADAPLARWALDLLGNATVLERPVRITTLVSALRSALRARRRQYDVRDGLEELHDTDRRKDEFLATLAHELRNPLSPLVHALHILREARVDEAHQARALAIMDRQIRGLVRLVDDLLDVSRITRGKLELRRERVDLATLLGHAIEAVQPQLETAGHRLSLHLPADAVELDADPVRLVQVFANLLGNAVKYTGPGGAIRVNAERRHAELAVSIRDTGIGIPSEALGRVFDPFVQVRATSLSARGGLGIGLALVKQLVAMHGGRIEARSEGPGKGSEFLVWLPIAGAGRGEPAPERDPRDGQRACARRRILVADDNRDAAESLGLVLELMGHEVRLAHDGEQALAEAEAFRPDLIVLDLGMPKLDGCATARRIREQPWGREAVLAALTGWGQAEVKRQTSAAGFDVHLVKPIDRSALDDLLARSGSSRSAVEPAARRYEPAVTRSGPV